MKLVVQDAGEGQGDRCFANGKRLAKREGQRFVGLVGNGISGDQRLCTYGQRCLTNLEFNGIEGKLRDGFTDLNVNVNGAGKGCCFQVRSQGQPIGNRKHRSSKTVGIRHFVLQRSPESQSLGLGQLNRRRNDEGRLLR